MSVEFRQRTPSEYARILWRRKWLIVLPALAISFAIAIVVWRLPDVYQSTTLLTVKPSSVPSTIAPQLSDEDLTLRLNNISIVVLSRSTLEPLIITHGLYAAERLRGEPMDLLVERMRKKDIQIELNKSRNDITNGFTISFRGPSRQSAHDVTEALASKFTSQQMIELTTTTKATEDLIDKQVQQAKEALETIEHQRFEFMTQHSSSLPNDSAALIGQLAGLYDQQKAYITEIGRLNDQHTMLSTQIGDAKKRSQTAIEIGGDAVTDPKTTPAWANLTQRETELEEQLQGMSKRLTPKNPDYQEVKVHLEAVKRQKQELLNDQKFKIEEKRKELERLAENDPSIKSLEYNQKFSEGELDRHQKLLDQTKAQIADIQQRLNGVPTTEVGLQALDREYQTAKASYDDLLEKQRKATISNQVNAGQLGEQVAVIDPASLPEKPVAPKRPLLIALGLVLGLGVGLVCAAAFEVPRLLTIQTVEDARHYTALPVLVSVPELLTPREQRRRRLRRATLAFAGIAVTIISIPALALLLKLTHVFELFTT
ncbi:MAG TPA: GNVR domain-containing protein [Pyrinomonadaceae bacterium]|nr:GNVR domain-containing protein [Pyrinomonadaceae bacterium]